jgi:thiol-disulfide isomerase/thioredoxin
VAACVAVALVTACGDRKPAASASPVAVPTQVASTASATGTRPHEDSIAWRTGDVDAAFAEAKAANKPVFLYWGAAWCPPCNQMKATLFNQRSFIERAEHFVPVYVDGDTPAAQTLATRFSVSGYPTMVLFKPDGTEITRLPGEADPEHYLQVLAIGMNAARPVRATLARALADGKGLVADDWRMLAWYSFDTDDQQLVPAKQLPSALEQLATRCPAGFPDLRARLALKAAAAAAPDSKGVSPLPSFDRERALAELERVLVQPAAARENFDLLTNEMPDLVKATTVKGSTARAKVVADADRALSGLGADKTLSNTDRIGALDARVALLTIDNPETADGRPVAPSLDDAMKKQIADEVARVDRESTNPYERQTVINAAAGLLTDAGMLDASDALLRAELAKSHSPYYFMLDLAANAKRRGDKAAAIDWTAKAYDGAKGPATRLQWGTVYVNTLVDLAPDDAARIEKVATEVLGEIEPASGSFDGRNRRRLTRMTEKLAAWSANGRHTAQARRIADAARALCSQTALDDPAQRRCGELLKVAVVSGRSTS